MARANRTISNTVGGELSPYMYGRFDLPVFLKGVAKAENFVLLPQGGARFRSGTQFVHKTKGNKSAVLIPFQFSDQQAYLIEATDQCFRFYKDGSIIYDAGKPITGITQANPGVVTAVAHGFAVNDKIFIQSVTGMTQVTGYYLVNSVPTADTLTLKTLAGVPVDTTAFTAYAALGYIRRAATAMTAANPGVITIPSHGFNNGDEVYIDGFNGPLLFNKRSYLVANATANDFTLTTLGGVPINTTSLGAYVDGGVAYPIYELTTPYLEADLQYLQFAQTADTMYIVNQNYEPRKLARKGHSNWTIATYARTADPFPPGQPTKWPRAVTFTDSGCLLMAGTKENPSTVWKSKGPSSGTTDFDNWTIGTTATDGAVFTLTAVNGRVDVIMWLANTNKFTVIGTTANPRRLYGATEQESITPTAVNAKTINSYGMAETIPVANGGEMYYVQRGGMRVRSLEYDITIEGYTTTDRNLVAEHLTFQGIRRIVEQQGSPDVIWGVRNDGKIIGLTYKEKEDISGWHRHYLGGKHVNTKGTTIKNAKALNAGIMLRAGQNDQLWFVVERLINGQTVRSVEFINDDPPYLQRDDFFTGIDEAARQADDTAFLNANYEYQKDGKHLDMGATYDGTAYGLDTNASLTPGAITGSGITFTASQPVFTASMVGREIWKQYDVNGDGGGRAVIKTFISSTQVTCDIDVPFNTATAIIPGNWYITATVISNLDHLEGETVAVITDGGVHPSRVVTNGSITLESQASKVQVGYPYIGIVKTMNIDIGGITGSAQAKVRTLVKLVLRLLNSAGGRFGTTPYNTRELLNRSTSDFTDRPVPLRSGNMSQMFSDRHTEYEKDCVVIQDVPLPFCVTTFDITVDTSDE